MAKREYVIFLAMLVMFAECHRVPRNSLNKAPRSINDDKPPKTGPDDVPSQPKAADGNAKQSQGSKAAPVETKIEAPKVVNSRKLDKTIGYKDTPESSSESDEISLFSSAAGLISGVLSSGRRNLDVLKSVPVVGNVAPMMDPLINGVSKIVQRSVDNAVEANLVELGNLYNRTNVLVKIYNEQFMSVPRTEEDNNNLEIYAKALQQLFGYLYNVNIYKTNSSEIAFTETVNQMNKRSNYTAVQLSAPVIKALGILLSVISLPVEIVNTVCTIDTPDAECINNVVRIVEIANTAECGSGDQAKFQIFKLALRNVTIGGMHLEEVNKNIINKVKTKIAATRRKRNSDFTYNEQANKPAMFNAELKPASMEVRRIRRYIAGNAPIGLNNDNAAINTDTKPSAGINAKPNSTPNQAQINAKPNIVPNKALNNAGIVPGIPASSTNNLANQNGESRRMNNNLGTNQAQIVPGILAPDSILLGSRRMNNFGASEKPIDVIKAVTEANIQANANTGLNNAPAKLNQAQVPVSNPALPSRRSNTAEFTHSDVFDLIIAELKAAFNNGQINGRCPMIEAIVNAQKVYTLCNVLLQDKVLDFTP